MTLRNPAKDDQLNKCISELSSSFRRCASETAETSSSSEQLPSSTTAAIKPRPASHFVTVIEVKESGKKAAAAVQEQTDAEIVDEMFAEVVAAGMVAGEKPPQEEELGEAEDDEEENPSNLTGQTNTTDDESLAESSGRAGVQRNKSSDSSGFGSDGQSNVMRLINKNNAVLAATNSVTKSGSTFSANSGDKIGLLSGSTTAAATGAEIPKKRIPPR